MDVFCILLIAGGLPDPGGDTSLLESRSQYIERFSSYPFWRRPKLLDCLLHLLLNSSLCPQVPFRVHSHLLNHQPFVMSMKLWRNKNMSSSKSKHPGSQGSVEEEVSFDHLVPGLGKQDSFLSISWL